VNPRSPWIWIPGLVLSAAAVRFLLGEPGRFADDAFPPPVSVQPAADHTSIEEIPPWDQLALADSPGFAGDNFATASRKELLSLLNDRLAEGASLEEVLMILEKVAHERPDLALEVAEAVGESDSQRRQLVTRLLYRWAGNDASSAWNWIERSPRSRDLLDDASLVSAAFSAMAGADPRTMVASAELAFEGSGSGRLDVAPARIAHAAVNALIAAGHGDIAREAVEGWVSRFPSAEMDGAPMAAVALHLAALSPTPAREWLESMPESPARSQAMARFADAWAGEDIAAAMQWSAGLAPDEGTASMRAVFGSWVEQNGIDASRWLGQCLADQYLGPRTDAMIVSLIKGASLVADDPESALEWARWISNAGLRSQTVERVLNSQSDSAPESSEGQGL